MSKKLMRKKLALMLANLKKKRPFYTEVEYLQSSGTQYIDSGIECTGDLVVQFKGSCSTNVNAACCGGINVSDPPIYFRHHWSPYGGSISYWIQRNSLDYASINAPFSTNTVYEIEVNPVNGVAKIDGVSYTFTPLASSYTTGKNFGIFGRYANNGNIQSRPCTFYYFKMYKSGTLVRDFIPVLDWSYTPCMYDKVSGELFYNQGTGTFSYGREIHYVEYLESSGTQYIDTGYVPNTNTECSMNVAFTSLDTTYRTPFSVRTSNMSADSFTMISANSTQNNNSFGFGTTFWSQGSELTVILNQKTKAVLRKNYAYWNGYTGDAGSSITPSSLTAYMFGRNANGTATNFFIGRIYDCQVKDNGTLVRDYKPAIDENGVGFMFDKVTHTCFLNAGTGSFSYPARELEYLESTGTQYIDTGLTKGDGSFTYNTDVAIVSTTNSARWAIAGADWNVSSHLSFNPQTKHFDVQNTYYVNYTVVYGTVYNLNAVYGSSNAVLTMKNMAGEVLGTTTRPTMSWDSSNTNTWLIGNIHFTQTAANDITHRIYKARIYQGSTLRRDYIPCFKDGVAGMLDKANNVFYQNAGSSTFGVGRILEKEYE